MELILRNPVSVATIFDATVSAFVCTSCCGFNRSSPLFALNLNDAGSRDFRLMGL